MKDLFRNAIVQKIYSDWNTYKVGMLADLRAETERNPLTLLRKELAAFHSQWATCTGVAVMPPLGDPLVLVHDDGPCANGDMYTPLVDGFCPVCKFHPDMQSTSFVKK